MAKSICDECENRWTWEMTPAQAGHFQSVPVACRACANKLARRVARLERLVARGANTSVYEASAAFALGKEASRILARRAKGRK